MAKCPKGHLLPSAWGAWPMALAAIRKLDEPSDLIWFLSRNKELQEYGKKWWTTWCTKWLQGRTIVIYINLISVRKGLIRNLIPYSCVLLPGCAQMHHFASETKASTIVSHSPNIWKIFPLLNPSNPRQLATNRSNTQVYPSMETTYWDDITIVLQRTTCPTRTTLSWAVTRKKSSLFGQASSPTNLHERCPRRIHLQQARYLKVVKEPLGSC